MSVKNKVDSKLNALLAAKKIIKCELLKYNADILLYNIKSSNNIPYFILFTYPNRVYLIDAKESHYKITEYNNYEIFLQEITNYIE